MSAPEAAEWNHDQYLDTMLGLDVIDWWVILIKEVGGQNFEWPNVEQQIFRKLTVTRFFYFHHLIFIF